MDETSAKKAFLGPGGQPVPAVTPEELKRVLESKFVQNAWAEQKAIGIGAFEAICGPLTDRNAVIYRAMLFGLLKHIAASAATIAADQKSHLETLNIIQRWFTVPTEPAYFAMAQIGLKWPNATDGAIRNERGQPVDLDEFQRLCETA